MLEPTDPRRCLCGCERDRDCRRGAELRGRRSQLFLSFNADLWKYILEIELSKSGDGRTKEEEWVGLRALYRRVAKLKQLCKTLHNRYLTLSFHQRLWYMRELHETPRGVESLWFQSGGKVTIVPEAIGDLLGLSIDATVPTAKASVAITAQRSHFVDLVRVPGVKVSTKLEKLSKTHTNRPVIDTNESMLGTSCSRLSVRNMYFRQTNHYVHWNVLIDSNDLMEKLGNTHFCPGYAAHALQSNLFWEEFSAIDRLAMRHIAVTNIRHYSGTRVRIAPVPHGPPDKHQALEILWYQPLGRTPIPNSSPNPPNFHFNPESGFRITTFRSPPRLD